MLDIIDIWDGDVSIVWNVSDSISREVTPNRIDGKGLLGRRAVRRSIVLDGKQKVATTETLSTASQDRFRVRLYNSKTVIGNF